MDFTLFSRVRSRHNLDYTDFRILCEDFDKQPSLDEFDNICSNFKELIGLAHDDFKSVREEHLRYEYTYQAKWTKENGEWRILTPEEKKEKLDAEIKKIESDHTIWTPYYVLYWIYITYYKYSFTLTQYPLLVARATSFFHNTFITFPTDCKEYNVCMFVTDQDYNRPFLKWHRIMNSGATFRITTSEKSQSEEIRPLEPLPWQPEEDLPEPVM